MLGNQGFTEHTIIANPDLDSRFVRVAGAIKYIRHGRVRHVGTVPIYQSYKTDDPILEVSAHDLERLKLGPLVPSRYTADDWLEQQATSSLGMRELMVSVAKGAGIEIGAGPHALRLPLDCNVTYVDMFDMRDQIDRMWPGYSEASMMAVDVKDSFAELGTFSDGSQDFIIASHVIEHLANPIKGIVSAFTKLRKGGFLFLIVPDLRYTFDRGRQLTSIKHLFEDYKSPSRERDFEHYLDYYRISAQAKDYRREAEEAFRKGLDIHFHTWTMPSFYRLIRAITEAGLAQWDETWWAPRVSADKLAMEFYFALRK